MNRPTDWHEVLGIDDPTPGDPYEIRLTARSWSGVADNAEHAETRLRGQMGQEAVATWIGKAGEAFRTHTSDLPDQLRKTKDSYRLASSALARWADDLDGHQATADGALVRGRAAQADLRAAHATLDHASGDMSSAGGADALTYQGDPASTYAPTPEQVTAARNRLASAQQARSHAQGLVDNAQTRLDAARQLALDAGQLREADGRTAAHAIRDAADAGIEPRSFWEKLEDAAGAAWSVLVTIAKVVVAVLGIVALIIGGPIAWIVFAAALIVLADTLVKYAQGKASLLDVGLALLACIPGTKGLTTFAELSAAFKAGGLLGAGGHLLMATKTTVVALAQSARAIRQGLVPGVKAAVEVLGAEGALALPQLRTTVQEMTQAFRTSMADGRTLVDEARSWQGSPEFPGIDDYGPLRLASGDRLAAGFPGVSNYAMPAGNAAAHGNSASGVWESVQVGPNGPLSPYGPGYRGSLVELHINNGMTVASGPTLANPAYGAGGADQFFFDIKGAIAHGDVSALDHAGNPVQIPAGTPPSDVNAVLNSALGGQGTITLTGASTWNPGILTQQQVAAAHAGATSPAIPTYVTHDDVRIVLNGAGYGGIDADLAGAR